VRRRTVIRVSDLGSSERAIIVHHDPDSDGARAWVGSVRALTLTVDESARTLPGRGQAVTVVMGGVLTQGFIRTVTGDAIIVESDGRMDSDDRRTGLRASVHLAAGWRPRTDDDDSVEPITMVGLSVRGALLSRPTSVRPIATGDLVEVFIGEDRCDAVVIEATDPSSIRIEFDDPSDELRSRLARTVATNRFAPTGWQ